MRRGIIERELPFVYSIEYRRNMWESGRTTSVSLSKGGILLWSPSLFENSWLGKYLIAGKRSFERHSLCSVRLGRTYFVWKQEFPFLQFILDPGETHMWSRVLNGSVRHRKWHLDRSFGHIVWLILFLLWGVGDTSCDGVSVRLWIKHKRVLVPLSNIFSYRVEIL